MLQNLRQIGRRRREPLFQPVDQLGDALGGDRLQYIVDRSLLEGVDSIFVVSGDKDDVTGIADRCRHVESVLDRHTDVEESDLRLELGRQRQRLLAVLCLGDDLELRPRLQQPRAQLRAQHRLVLGDQRGDAPSLPLRLH